MLKVLTKDKEILSITGIRAIAILSVFIFHIDQNIIPRGYLGVDIFFLISGYVVTLSITRKNQFSLTGFYLARIRRITPALMTMIFLALSIGYIITLPKQYFDLAEQARSVLLLYSNWYFNYKLDYFSDSALNIFLLHCWSLSIEEQFYIIYPFFFIFYRQKITPTLLFILLLISAVYGYQLFNGGESQLAFYSSFARAWQFLLGSLIALNFSLKNENHVLFEKRKFINFIFSYASVAIVFIFLFIPKNYISDWYSRVFICFSCSILLVYCNTKYSPFLLKNKILVYIGRLSYSLYLYHWPVIVTIKLYFHDNFYFLVISIFSSLLLSIFSYHYIESPFRKIGKEKSESMVLLAGGSVFTSLILILFTIFVTKNAGLPDRIPISVLAALNASNDIDHDLQKCFDPPGEKYQEALPVMAKNDKLCRIGYLDAENINFILIGDSHGFSISPSFNAAGKFLKKKGVLAVHAGCPSLAGVTHGMARDHKCSQFFDSVSDIITKYNIKNIFLISRWDLYVLGGMPGSMDSATPQ